MNRTSEALPVSQPDSTADQHPIPNNVTRDYTKSGWYVGVDLMLKTISALAIVLLGYAGWRLQHESEATRAAADTREHAERKYLPELRSISEVEVALLETSKEFDWVSFTKSEAAREARLGAHLTYLGSSLYFPDGEPKAYIVSAADNIAKAGDATEVKTTARCAVLFLAEFMRYAPLFQQWAARSDARVVVREQRILIVDLNQRVLFVDVLDPRTANLWQRWLPPGGATPASLFRDVDLTVFADDIDEQLLAICDDLLKKHSDLADRYVEIRSEVLKSRSNLLE